MKTTIKEQTRSNKKYIESTDLFMSKTAKTRKKNHEFSYWEGKTCNGWMRFKSDFEKLKANFGVW